MTTSNGPLPRRPPEPGDTGAETAEVASARAELQILLFPTRLSSGISVPASQSRRLIEMAGRLAQLTLVVTLVIGTLFGAGSAHLSPAMTTAIVLVELVTALGLAQFRRSSRRR